MKIVLLAFIALLSTHFSKAQLTGTKNVPGDYATLAEAITDLNAQGVGSGGVTINVIGGNSQTAPAGGYQITATGTAVNPVFFEGNNNTITASAAQTVGSTNDGVFKIIGADYITIKGFAIQENAANTTTAVASNNMTEYGIAVLQFNSNNGSQHVTITNNTIILNRTYTNTFGIYSNNSHIYTDPTVINPATSLLGVNSNLTIKSNTISNVNVGIACAGADLAVYHLKNLVIGGTTASEGNTITDFGTGNNTSTFFNISSNNNISGIYLKSVDDYSISNNTIKSSSGAVGASINLRAIYHNLNSGTANFAIGTYTNRVNDNTIEITAGAANTTIGGIRFDVQTASSTSSLELNRNKFLKMDFNLVNGTTATSVALVDNQYLNVTIDNNEFNNLNINTSGNVILINHNYTMPAGGTQTITNNKIVGTFNKSVAGGSLACIQSTNSSNINSISIISNNDFSNITVSGTTSINGINNADGNITSGGPVRTVANNVFTNWSSATGVLSGIIVQYYGGSSTVTNNTVSNLSTQNAITAFNLGNPSSTYIHPSLTIGNNTMHTLTNSSNGGGSVIGLLCGNSAANVTIASNIVHTLTCAAANTTSTGISYIGASNNAIISKNKIYNISGDKNTTNVHGINAGSNTSTGAKITITGNYIGDLRATAASQLNAISGINATILNGVLDINFNTIYLNANSSATTFGNSCLSINTNIKTVALRNNIFYNNSTPGQNASNNYANGVIAAIRYVQHGSTGTIPTSYSLFNNNNDFYVNSASGSNNHLVYVEGSSTIINPKNTLAHFKSFLGTAEQNSVSEIPNFLSTNGSDANFLHINAGIASELESGATAVSGITTDYDNDIRNSSTPDIGADEFSGTVIDNNAPNILFTPVSQICAGTTVTLPVTITDASGVPTSGAGLPVLYWRKNNASWNNAVATHLSGNNYLFSFAVGTVANDKIEYYIVAQDNQPIPKAIAFPSTGVSGYTTAPPTANTAPTNLLNFITGLSGTFTVGTSGFFKTLNEAIETYNTNCLAGHVVFSLIDASYTTNGEIIKYNPTASATSTLTIKPTVTTSITGLADYAIITFSGARYVTINGSTSNAVNSINPLQTASRDLTITNTSSSNPPFTSVIWITNDNTNGAANSAIINSNIIGQSTTSTMFGIGIGAKNIGYNGSSITTSDISIINNNVQKVQIGIASIGKDLSNRNSRTTINLNTLGATTSGNEISFGGIFSNMDDNITIAGNRIVKVSNNNNRTIFGIGLGYTPSGTNVTPNYSLNSNNTEFVCSNALVTKNKIEEVINISTNGSVVGIALFGASTGTSEFSNNVITGVSGNTINTSEHTSGMFLQQTNGTGAVKVYHNSISMTGTRANGTKAIYALLVGGATSTTFDIRNNILHNTQTHATGSKSYAIGLGVSNIYTNVSCNNNALSIGSGANFYIGTTNTVTSPTDRITFADWKTATSQDANSVSTNPIFNSTTDLHLQQNNGNYSLDNKGIPITTINNDVENFPRSSYLPDMGAYEFSACIIAPPTTTLAGTVGSTVGDARDISVSSVFFNECGVITRLQSLGTNPVDGIVNASVTLDPTMTIYNNICYVQRHVDIEPQLNASTATGTVTLYVKQTEFDNFNSNKTTSFSTLPTASNDNTGIANIRIIQFHGTGTNPTNYTGGAVVINPADADIFYNSDNGWWEIKFDVSGFSGFYITSLSGVLANDDLLLSGKTSSTKNTLNWQTTNENGTKQFVIEKSSTGTNFIPVATTNTKGNGNNNYTYVDESTSSTVNYYRIKKQNNNGKIEYSNIIKLVNNNNNVITIYPNPAKHYVVINTAPLSNNNAAKIINSTGAVIKTIAITTTNTSVDISNLPKAVYYILVNDLPAQKLIIN
jgi:trimeric autotransporter adhesin